MTCFRKLLSSLAIFLIITSMTNMTNAMQDKSLECESSALSLRPAHDNSYLLSKDGQPIMRVTLSPRIGIDEYFLNPARGETLWFDPEDMLEITLSIPPLEHEYAVLDAGLGQHLIESNLDPDQIKIFLSVFYNNIGRVKSNQTCGFIGFMIGDNLCFHSIGTLDRNPDTLRRAIQNIEIFAIQNGAKRAQFHISDSMGYFIGIFKACGYAICDKVPDLNTGGFEYLFSKNLEHISGWKISYNVEFTWLPTHDEQKRNEIARIFFSEEILKHLQKFVPDSDDNSQYLVGVFVRNRHGQVVGGCVGHISLNAKIPHLFVDAVWLDKSLRGKKLSERFMGFIEATAKKFGCLKSRLGTSDFQAPWLYKKLGYTVEEVIPNFFKDRDGNYYSEYYFLKDL